MSNITNSNYNNLKEEIGNLLVEGRKKAAMSANTILIETYWQIGRHIAEFEQGGKEKAKYGKELLTKLAEDLTVEYGKGGLVAQIYFKSESFILHFQKSRHCLDN